MFSRFVVFFRSLSFLRYWFSGSFVVLFGSLGFLCSRFSGGFVVFFRSLSFLLYSGFRRGFFVFLGCLSFLFCSRFGGSFVMFFMVSCLGSGAVSCSSRCLSGACCISSESSGRQTHSSGNDQS
ncbi:hypothetical protein AF47_00781 [Klebsiella aerogenes MGH 61]|nr:hypothetical protein AF47_00781 [Klebsiella aerogenes MGH 61]